MEKIYRIDLTEDERQLLNDALHMCSTFAANITEKIPVDFEDAEIIKRVLDKPEEFKALLVKFNRDKF